MQPCTRVSTPSYDIQPRVSAKKFKKDKNVPTELHISKTPTDIYDERVGVVMKKFHFRVINALERSWIVYILHRYEIHPY